MVFCSLSSLGLLACSDSTSKTVTDVFPPEDETTEAFYKLHAQAEKENDLLAIDFIYTMIREQLEEMELARTVNQIVELSTDWLAIQDAIVHLQ